MSLRRALIVAPHYLTSPEFPPLPGALELVRRLGPCLGIAGGYDVHVLNGNVGKGDLRRELTGFFDSDGELLLYFYGHGCIRPTGTAVFATSDALPFDEGVDMTEVARQAAMSRAREAVVVVDCCHAAACTSPVNGAALASIAKEPTARAGRAFLAGCREDQNGWEAPTEGARMLGAFSATVLDGLEGGAADRFAASNVGAMLLGQYVLEEFRRWGQDPVVEVKAQGGLACTIVSGVAPSPPPPPETPGPRFFGAPFRPSAMFVGRAAELDALSSLLLHGDRPIAVSASLEGLGGIGKTELVLQLTHQPEIQSAYSNIVWLDASGPLLTQWQSLARDLNVDVSTDDPRRLVNAVAAALGDPKRCLFILDNATTWDVVSDLIPVGGPLLVTTRAQGFGGNAFVHTSLDVLDDASARDLLVRMVPDLSTDSQLPRLVTALQGHALALELAGWNINHLGGTASDYLERLDRHEADLPLAVSSTTYRRTVEGCLALTWDSLREPGSRILWRRASLFAPVSAHRDLLKASATYEAEVRLDHYRSLSVPPEGFEAAYAELRSVHVLARVEGHKGERWAMHRLVRDFGRIRLQRFDTGLHSFAIAEWLLRPTLPRESELPHLVAAVLEAARHVDEMRLLGVDRAPAREIAVRGLFRERARPGSIIDYIRGEIRDPRALQLMLEALVDVNDDVRAQAVVLIDRVGPIPEVLEGLKSSLTDPEPRIRMLALRTLTAHATDRTIAIMVEAGREADLQSGAAIASALALIGDDRARAALTSLLENPSLPAASETKRALARIQKEAGR